MLRRHQREFRDILESIRAGHRAGRMILLDVTPGGGKSLIPVIAAKVGIPRIADAVCVVTPRESLQAQMEDGFIDPYFRKLLEHDLRARQSTNERDPSRGLAAYVTTYQAIMADKRLTNVHEFDRQRYILVLDECHHIEEDGAYHRAVQPLVDRAAAVVLMTGTLERDGGSRIAYVPYTKSIEGRTVVDVDGGMPVIRYSRPDALDERVIVPLVFQHLDGDVSWVDRNGETVDPLLLSLAGSRSRDALFTALRTEYARDLLSRTVRDWQSYRRQCPGSRLLAVAPTIPLAKTYLKWAKEFGVDRIEIATSDDPTSAKHAIDQFKAGHLDALMTVAMAYEGLDCKQITHVACLTHIRSRPWINQLISRANRYDPKAGPWGSQRGFIYSPDDQEMVQIFDDIKAEQEPFIRDEAADGPSGTGERRKDPSFVVPLDGRVTRTRAGSLDGETLDYAETEAILTVLQRRGYEGIVSPTDALDIFRDLQKLAESGFDMRQEDAPAGLRPSQEEQQLRDAIEGHCRAWDHENGYAFGTLNRTVYQHFGKPRPDMRLQELRDVWAWIGREWPLQKRA